MCKLQEKEKNKTLNHVIIFQTLQAALRFNSGPSPYEQFLTIMEIVQMQRKLLARIPPKSA